jgi:hypothetical protein
MTEWSESTVRHIPEEELHAYLDQALSRSQCVEIERHLARCPGCRLKRDAIAALRDRTTELLARVGPPPIIPPAFETLRSRSVERARRRWRWIARGAWAASLLVAVLAGWRINRRHHPSSSPDIAVASTSPAQAITPEPPPPMPVATQPARHSGRPARAHQLVRKGPPPQTPFARAVEADPDTFFASPERAVALGSVPLNESAPSAQPVGMDPGLQGLWRTIVPDSGGSPPARDIPLVPGLPVVQMRVQPGNGSSEVTAVDQVLESGDVIRTIAGPATRVGSMVDKDSAAGSPGTGQAGGLMTVTIRQGDRMVAVTGPSQALGSLLSRVNVKRRRY